MIPGNRVSVDGPVGRGQQHAGPAQRRRPSCGGGSRVSGKEPSYGTNAAQRPVRLAASRKTRSVNNPHRYLMRDTFIEIAPDQHGDTGSR